MKAVIRLVVVATLTVAVVGCSEPAGAVDPLPVVGSGWVELGLRVRDR